MRKCSAAKREVLVAGLLLMNALLAGCGGGSGSGNSSPATPTTLAAGSTYTMPANASVEVPSGTVVNFSGSSVTVNGSGNTVRTQAGAVVTVPPSATGPADNTVTTVAAGSGAAPSTALTVALLAGSATTNLNPVDGTGSSAVLWGGGHLVADSADEIVFSDRGGLRKVTQAGVVTTLLQPDRPCNLLGIAIDSAGDVDGSASAPGGASGQFVASICEWSESGSTSVPYPNWETANSAELGNGGLAINAAGMLYLADPGTDRIVEFAAGSSPLVLAGSGANTNTDGTGVAASFSMQDSPDLPIDNAGNLYLSTGTSIRKITPAGVVTTIVSGLTTDGEALARDSAGNFYVHGVGTLYRIAGDGSVASFQFPQTQDFVTSMTTDAAGNLYVGTRGQGAQIFKVTF